MHTSFKVTPSPLARQLPLPMAHLLLATRTQGRRSATQNPLGFCAPSRLLLYQGSTRSLLLLPAPGSHEKSAKGRRIFPVFVRVQSRRSGSSEGPLHPSTTVSRMAPRRTGTAQPAIIINLRPAGCSPPPVQMENNGTHTLARRSSVPIISFWTGCGSPSP